MSKETEIPIEKRNVIVDLHKSKKSFKEIAEVTKVNFYTVRYIIRKWKKIGQVANISGRGRKMSTTPRFDRQIIKEVTLNRSISAPKLNAGLLSYYQVQISDQTVRNRIKSQGYNGRVARKKPLVSRVNEKKRFNWAKAHSGWTLEDWKKVMFTDESKFCLFESGGNRRVWRKAGEALKKECLRPTVKHGGGN